MVVVLVVVNSVGVVVTVLDSQGGCLGIHSLPLE